MKKLLWLIVCLMTMVVNVNAHNIHYPTYTEDGITYVKNGTWTCIDYDGEIIRVEPWDIQKVDKPYDRTITIPYKITINGERTIVGGIRENAFATCACLDSLILSDGIMLSSSPKALKGCKELEYLYYSTNGCTHLHHEDNKMPIFRCKTFETNIGSPERYFWEAIGNSVENIIIRGGHFFGVFRLCKNLRTIICYSDVAPSVSAPSEGYSCEDKNFQSWQWEKITLYVPRESLEKYYFDRVWGEIDNIYALDEMPTTSTNNTSTSINFVTNSVTEDDVWYSFNGTKVNKPTKGVYIKNGKKYVIK